jgi:hypothetical protein
MMLAAGNLDRGVTITERIQQSGAVDGMNNSVWTYGRRRDVWAQMVQTAQAEVFDGDTRQRYATRTVVFRIRWLPGMRETDQLECEGRTYDVKGIRELGRREGLEITAELQI